MRNPFLLILVVLVFAVCAVAGQQSPQAQTGPANNSGQSTTPDASSSSGQSTTPGASSSSGQAATPGASSSDQGTAAANSRIIEGCLGGSSPNFTVTNTSGTVYRLDIPQSADASVLTSHVGESVQVLGVVNDNGSSSAASSGSTSSSANQHSIQVSKIGRGTSACSANKGAMQKPPAQ